MFVGNGDLSARQKELYTMSREFDRRIDIATVRYFWIGFQYLESFACHAVRRLLVLNVFISRTPQESILCLSPQGSAHHAFRPSAFQDIPSRNMSLLIVFRNNNMASVISGL